MELLEKGAPDTFSVKRSEIYSQAEMDQQSRELPQRLSASPHSTSNDSLETANLRSGEPAAKVTEIVALRDYPQDIQLLMVQAMEKILSGRSAVDARTLKGQLVRALTQLFVHNSRDTSTGLELLRAINELTNGEETSAAGSDAIASLQNQQPEVVSTYQHLFSNEVSNEFAFDDAETKALRGQGVRAKTVATLEESRKFVNETRAELQTEIDNATRELSEKKETHKNLARPRYASGDEYPRVTEVRRLIGQRIEILEAKITKAQEKLAKLLEYEKSLAAEERAFALIDSKFDLKATEERYSAGIALADRLVTCLPLTFKAYNDAYFHLLQQENKALEAGTVADRAHITEKFRAAKLHLHAIYLRCLFYKDALDTLKVDFQTIEKELGLSLQKQGDYRDISLAEEISRKIYTNYTHHYHRIAAKNSVDADFYGMENLIAAIIYYRLTTDASWEEIEAVGINSVIDFYFKHKRVLFPFQDSRTVPQGYYSFQDFKKRGEFDSQTAFNEQFNVYKDNYMKYDVDTYLKFTLLSKQIPLHLVLSPPIVVYEYNYDQDTEAETKDLSKPRKGKITAIKLADESWLLLIRLHGKMQSLYIKSDEIGKSGFRPYLEPEKYFGKRDLLSETVIGPRFVTADKVYPPGSLSQDQVDYHGQDWEELGYSAKGTPVFRWIPELTVVGGDKTALEHAKSFTNDSYDEINNMLKDNLDETGIWHHVATTLVPFYGVIYEAVTDRYYTLSPQEGLTIALDTLSVFIFLTSVGLKFAEMSQEFAMSIAISYRDHLMTGLSRKEALTRVLQKFSVGLEGVNYAAYISTVGKEFATLFNPLPLDLRQTTFRLYRFSAKIVSTTATGMRKMFSRLSTKINPAWKVKDEQIIRQISATKPLENGIYHLENATHPQLENFIKQGEDYYPVVADSRQQHWYVTDAATDTNAAIGTKAGEHKLQLVANVDNEYRPVHIYKGKVDPATFTGEVRDFNLPINTISQYMFEHSRSIKKTEAFSAEKGQYEVDQSFIVVPMGNNNPAGGLLQLDKTTALGELRQAQREGQAVLNRWNSLSDGEKASVDSATNKSITAIENALATIERTIKDLEKANPDEMLFALVRKDQGERIIPNKVYGIAKLTYEKGTHRLIFDELTKHPYAIAAQDPYLANMLKQSPPDNLADDAIYTPPNLDEYNIRHVGEHLGTSSLRQAIDIRAGQVKMVSIQTHNPVVEALVDRLKHLLDPIGRINQNVKTAVVNIGQRAGTSIAGIKRVITGHTPPPPMEPVKAAPPIPEQPKYPNVVTDNSMLLDTPWQSIRTDLHPLPKFTYEEPEKATKDLRYLHYRKGFTVVTYDINAPASDPSYNRYISAIKPSAHNLINQLERVIKLLEKRKTDPKFKAAIDKYLIDAFKLEREIKRPVYATALSTADILDKVTDRLEVIATKLLAFMEKHRANKFRNIVVLAPRAGNPFGEKEAESTEAYVMPTDPQERIHLVFNENQSRINGLPNTLAHEGTHFVVKTKDFAYFHGISNKKKPGLKSQSGRVKDITEINATEYEYFADDPKEAKNLARFILNVPGNTPLSYSNKETARKLFKNNLLVSSDVLLNNAEFDMAVLAGLDNKVARPLDISTSRQEREAPDQSVPPTEDTSLTGTLGAAALGFILN